MPTADEIRAARNILASVIRNLLTGAPLDRAWLVRALQDALDRLGGDPVQAGPARRGEERP